MFRKATFSLFLMGAFFLPSAAQSSFGLSHLLSTGDPLAKNIAGLKAPQSSLETGTALFNNYFDNIPGTNLIGAYKLDGNALDSTGINHGTQQGTFTTTANRYGEAGKALVFNGTSNYISTEKSYSNPGPITVSIWFKTAPTTVGGTLIGFSNQQIGTTGSGDRFIYMTSEGKLIAGAKPLSNQEFMTSPNSPRFNDNKWHLATMTIGPTGFHLYMDGEETNWAAIPKSAGNYTGYWRIGHGDLATWNSHPSSFFFDGALDDALIYHRQLSAEEIKEIYYPVVNATVVNTCLNQSNGRITVGVSGGVPPYQYSIDGAAYIGTNVFSNRAAGSYVIRVRDANNRVSLETIKVGIQTLSQVSENSVIGFYKMSGNANDEYGINNGTFRSGTPVSTPDRFTTSGKAYTFNGDQYMYTSKEFNSPQEFTISIWFKTNATTGGKLIGFGNKDKGGLLINDLSTSYDRHLYMSNTGQLLFGVYANTEVIVQTQSSYNDNKWHHALATYSSAGLYLYMDGVLSGSNTQQIIAKNYKGYWRIGGDNLKGWPASPISNYFKGTLDDALIYNRVVTPEEIDIIYRSADGAGNNGPVCAGASLNLTATSFPGASYSWTGPAGFTSGVQNPTFPYTNTSAGTYTVSVTSSTTCVMTAQTTVTGLNNPGQWTGNVSSDWNNVSNWCDGIIPTTATNVTIFAGAARMPVINAGASVRDITIAPGATLTTQASGILNISGMLKNTGTMTNTGTTIFDGTTQQTYSGVPRFNHITLNNAQGLKLTDSLVAANVTILSGTLFANEKNISMTGNWTNNSGTGAFVGGSAQLRLVGTAPQTIGGSAQTTFNTLYASSGGSTITLIQNINIKQNLIVGGIFDLGTFTANRQSVGGTLYVNALGHLKIGGTNTLPSGYTTNTFLLAGKVEYSGTAQPISGQSYGTLILSSSSGTVIKTAGATPFSTQADFIMRKGNGTAVSFSNNANLNIGKNLLLEAGATLQANASIITVNGHWQNDGIFSGMSGKVILAGASSSVQGTGGQNFNNLTIAGNYVTFSNHALILTGNFETIGQGVFTQSPGGTLTMTGNSKSIKGTGISIENLTVSGAGNVTIHPSLIISGNLIVATAANSINTIIGSNITMSGSGKTISGTGSLSFVNLNITGSIVSSSDFTIGGGLNVDGNLSATSKRVTFSGNTTLSGTANLYDVTIEATKLQLSANSVLGISNGFIVNTGASLDVSSSIPNTVNYNGARNQSLNGVTYHNLVLSNGFNKTASGAITVNHDLEIQTVTTFIGDAHTHIINHNWTNNGFFTKNGGTIRFAGSSTSAISGYTDFNNLTVDQADASSTVILLSDVKTNLLNMTKGRIETGSNKIEITNTRTGSGLIWGNIQITRSFVSGTPYAFGGPENLLSFVDASGITTVTVQVEKGTPANFPLNASINRWYNITIPFGTYSSATWRMEYDDVFLNGNDETSLEMWNNRSGSWAPQAARTSFDPIANYVERSGLNDLSGTWTLSSTVSKLDWIGALDSDWNKPGNWQEGRVPGLFDIVQIGSISFNHQPIISNNVSVKNIVFGSAKGVVLELATGGSLTSSDISGTWNSNVTHIINTNNQALNVLGNVSLGDGAAGHSIHLNIGNSTANILGWISLPAGAKIDFTGNGILKIGEKIVLDGGVFTAGTGTVEYNGTITQDIEQVSYHHLTINKSSGIADINKPLTIEGNLTILSGILENENYVIIKGNVTIENSSTLENNHTIEVGGNWLNDGTYTPSGFKTIFNGAGMQTISKSTFNNMEFNKPVNSLVELTGDVTVKGSLIGTSGILDIKNFQFNRDVLGGSATMTDNATLIIGDNNAPTLFGNYYMSPGSTIIFDGTVEQVLQLPGLVYGNVIFRNSGIKQLTIPITVAGTLSIENGATLNGGSNTLTLLGNWDNAGTFAPESGTVVWKGTGKSITGVTTFNQVIISGNYQVNSTLTYNNTLEITNTGVGSSGAGINLLLHGDVVNYGTINIVGEAIFSGNVLQTLKLVNATTNIRTVTFNGTVSPQMISTSVPQFGILNVNNTGGVNPSVGWTVLLDLNVGAGAFFNGGTYFHTILGNMNNLGTITSSGNLNFSPSVEVVLNFGTQFSSTGLVNLDGVGKMTMVGTPASFKNLTIANTNVAGISPSSDLTVTNNFVVKDGALMNAGMHQYYIGGNFENHGTLLSQTSRFIFNGTGRQKITTTPLSSLHHVTLSKTSGEAIMLTDMIANGTLDFISGTINTGTKILSLTAAALVSNASQTNGWVNGKLNKFITSGTLNKTFEIGDHQYFTPVDLDFTSITTPGGLTVSTTAGDHPQISISAIDSLKSINRYYTISTTGLAVSSYNSRFHFVLEDIDAGVVLENVYLSTCNGSSWVAGLQSEYEELNSLRATNLTWFGGMAIGQICNLGTTISYSQPVFCTIEGMAEVIAEGTLGGVFSAEPGLSLNETSGEVNLGSSTPGEYVVTYFIEANSGCREFISRASIEIGIDGLWTGMISSDWTDDSNWSCSGVPTQLSNITIPSGLINYPLITGIGKLHDLDIQTGASMIVTGTLQLFGSLTNAGFINLTAGVLEMSGTNEQVISPLGFENNSIENLVINNMSVEGVTLDAPLDVTGAVGSDGQGFTFKTNNYLTLKSSASGSARVGNMTGNTIIGDVIVEHYLSAHKAWRLLSIPTNTTQSINQSWQEGADNTNHDPLPGYGTQVMSNRATWESEGFDRFAGGGPSIKTWNNTADNWIGVTSAHNKIEFNGGYFLIIRGDRLSNAFISPVTETTLRTKGPLKMGDQPKIVLPPNGYSVIGNPYAAPVDFRKITRSEGIDSAFRAWDPYIQGNYSLGGYQTISGVNDWIPTPGGTYMYPTGVKAQNLQSGQAVFVHTSPVVAFLPHEHAIKFTEEAKAGESSPEEDGVIARGGVGGNNEKKLLRVTLLAVTQAGNIVADGNAVAFSRAYSNAVDGDDALKILAGGENFGLLREGKILAIEARNEINENDTLHYYMTNVARKPYRLHFEPINFYRANVQAYMVDNFLQTTTPLRMFDTSGIDINITANAASAATDRFKITFRPMVPLSVIITSVKAVVNKKDIDVTWKVSGEEGIAHYEVERSFDGYQFIKTHSTKATNRYGSRYSWKDESPQAGDHYYRIRIVSQNGEVNYSEIVKVLVDNSSPKISVYPNPVTDGKITVRFENQPDGKYSLRLFNAIGQLMIKKQVDHKGKSSNAVIQLSDKHAKGIYRLEIQNIRGEVQTIQVIH